MLRKKEILKVLFLCDSKTHSSFLQVKMMTNHLPCGSSVEIDIEADEPMSSIKQKLEQATGVPVEFQKVVLGSISELYMGDRR